ncbi:Cobalt-zinc-cadmium resistance protein [Fulvivirga imtechensis AK7]|uniref:Cobalt-zinc-cadmium resistance protein n=1 Tax=Fulvivirga imtechensis AK7 TaxID=1237149 RepID=L8JNQ0_9BACT|nr:cation diffusion facilitator family transporter [Fulvivirga imtechensis]ELR70470.1 Cobalt-zinc-cadmium resistance protein [Fulvivirga imtechensis AK7]
MNKEVQENISHPTEKGLKTTLTGIIISTVLAVVKALGGIFGNSYALIADAIESAGDVLSSTMLWLGLKWSARPPDKNHPYGHGKAEALIALGIALALTTAAIIITKDSINNILTPHKTPAPFTLIILVGVVVVKELLYRYVLKTAEEINSGAVKADAFHHRSDAITSVAAFVGISIAIIGGEGYESADDYAAILAAIVIGYNAYHIARPAIGELLDESLVPELNKQVKELAFHVKGVHHVEKCYTRKMGVMHIVDMHIWVDSNISVADGHEIAHEVKNYIQENLPEIQDVLVHIEPSEIEALKKEKG